MRYLLLLFLLSSTIFALSQSSCYSVEIQRFKKQQEFSFQHNEYPKNCHYFSFSVSNAIRCGCYDTKEIAKKNSQEILRKYPHAIITPTYRYRFYPHKIIVTKKVFPIKKQLPVEAEIQSTKVTPLVKKQDLVEESSIDKQFDLEEYITLKTSFLNRSFSSKEEYKSSPYTFAMIEGMHLGDNYEVDVGLAIFNTREDSGVMFNQASYTYFGESLEFKLGKYVETIGVLDYMSSINIVNPSRTEFFEDENINIRKIPLLMASVTYYHSDSLKFKAIVQPFDSKYQDYTSVYLNFILDAYLPNYFNSLSANNSNTAAINEEIFLPTYNESISPALNSYIQNRYDTGTTTDIDKAGAFLLLEYSSDDSNYGAVWINRYSEIPYIEIDQEVIKVVQSLENGSITQGLEEFIENSDGTLISKVEGYRYNQYSVYYEGTLESVGIRLEATIRDKIPTINEYSWLSSIGMGIDYKAQSIYNSLELQWFHLDSLNEDMYAGVLTTKLDAFEYGDVGIYLDHYLLFGYYNATYEISTFPNVTFSYENINIILQYLASKEQSKLNSASIILKVIF